MFLIFSLNRLDVLPLGDVGFKRSFAIQYKFDRSKQLDKHIISAAKKWGSYKSIAAWYLWHILEN
jgi:DNA-3-methyladenine glycosylase II